MPYLLLDEFQKMKYMVDQAIQIQIHSPRSYLYVIMGHRWKAVEEMPSTAEEAVYRSEEEAVKVVQAEN